MSWQAQSWADGLPYSATTPIGFRVLSKLANVAADDGTRAWRSKKDMADELDVSERTIQRGLKELRIAALIRPGDQRHVMHIPANRRPTVFDLNMPRKAPAPTLPNMAPGETARGDSQGRHDDSWGDRFGPSGETTVVAKNDPRTNTKTKKESHVGERERASDENRGEPLPWNLHYDGACAIGQRGHRHSRRFGSCVDCGAGPVPRPRPETSA